MTDIMREAQQYLANTFAEIVAQSVSIVRNGKTTTAVQATMGMSTFSMENAGDYGVYVEQDRMQDWLIKVADYQIGGVPVKPERGDKIVWSDGSLIRTYLVIGPGEDPPWRYDTPQSIAYRVHSREISENEVE